MDLNPKEFSNINRASVLEKASKDHYDLIIIGGGITGAGIALDAALRGLKVFLTEKKDFASGTSSKSTKLIHGGLRYLKQFELGLVRETGLERAVAHNNACHLVHPENMLLPIVEEGTFSQFTAGIAIRVYDILADVDKHHRRKKLSREEVIDEEPLLNVDILKSGIIYSEYRTDDARLTIEIIKAARKHGVTAMNYLEVTGFKYKDDKICGIECKDGATHQSYNIFANKIVSATGPWVDEMRQIDKPSTHTNLHLTKGVHIVVAKKDFQINNAIYFDAFDGRMIFAIPRQDIVYIGTTDTSYDKDQDNLFCNEEDAKYLIAAINNIFNIEPLTIAHIQSSWTGLRPLIQQEGKGPSELSRKEEIFVSDSGLISIAGGKLTGYRKMAERIVDLVVEELPLEYSNCQTKDFKIHRNPYSSYEEFLQDVKKLKIKYNDDPVAAEEIEYLISTFGKDAHIILNAYLQKQRSDKSVPLKDLLVEAQIEYCMKYESVSEVLDFVDRRTGWLFFNINKAKKYTYKVAHMLAAYLDKNDSWTQNQIELTQNTIDINNLAEIK